MSEAASIVQEVKTVFTAEMGSLRAEMARIGQTSRGAGAHVAHLQRQISGLSTVVLGATAALGAMAGYGAVNLVKGLIDISAKTETANLGMALMIQSADRLGGKTTSFASALGEAAGTMDKLRKAARDTPGTLDQVQSAYQAILGAGKKGGMGQDEMVSLAAQIATQDALSNTPGLVIRDVSQALRGRNDADSGVLQMSGVVPKAAEMARKGDQGGALRKLGGALAVDPAMLKASGESFGGRLATFSDQVDEIKRKVGAPLFAAATAELSKWSDWLDKNSDAVEKMASEVGKGLVVAFEKVKSALVWMYEHREEIILWAKMLVGASLLAKAVEMTLSIAKAFKGLGAVFTILAAHPFFRAIALAGAVIGGAASLFNTGNHHESPEGFWLDRSVPGNALEIPDTIQPGSEEYFRFRIAKQAEAGLAPDPHMRRSMDAITDAKLRAQGALGTDAGFSGSFGADGGQSMVLTQSAVRKVAKLQKNTPFAGGGVNIDARNAKITLNTKLDTDNPAAFADVSLKNAFLAASASPLSATFALGAPRVAQ